MIFLCINWIVHANLYCFQSKSVQLPSNSLHMENGSKPVTRNQTDYFGKGLQVFFPKNNTCANEFFNETFCNLFF